MRTRSKRIGRPLVEFVFMIHIGEVQHLLELAARQRRRRDSEIVCRAAVVFLVAVWQTYVEAVADSFTANGSGISRARISTPNGSNIDLLFKQSFGIPEVSRSWKWRGMTAVAARDKLQRLIKLRHEIAHKARLRSPIRRSVLLDYVHFIHRLAVCLHNAMEQRKAHLSTSTSPVPMRYGGVPGFFSAPAH